MTETLVQRDVYLDKMEPNQVTEYWDVLREHIMPCLSMEAQGTKQARVNALRSILIGRAELWLFQSLEELLAVFILTVHRDPLVGSRHLLVYGMNIVGRVTREEANQALETLQRYAQGIGCSNIIGWTAFQEVVNLVEKAGGVSNMHLVELPLDTRFKI